ncbi:MAG: hypothetical protein KF762_07305 [Acidobacteria bacterium]|nr:hypothetical protein [Acidobacteriota bacterium]
MIEEKNSGGVDRTLGYWFLFRIVSGFEAEARKQTAEGRLNRAAFLWKMLERKTGVGFAQAINIKNYASQLEVEFGCISTRPRSQASSSATRKQLISLELEDRIIGFRDQLRDQLNEPNYAKLEQFVSSINTDRPFDPQSIRQHRFFFGFFSVDYDFTANEVVGYSYTDMPPGHCTYSENIVGATLSSDSLGIVDTGWSEACAEIAQVFLYYSNPLPDDRFCVDGDHAYVKTFGRQIASVGSYCASGKVQNLPPSEDCLVTPSLPNVTSVSLEVINPGTIGIDQNPNIGGGLRVFPDDDVPGDTVDRRQLRVTARINENRAGVEVFFRNFDLDDPSTDTTIDPNGTAGDDNIGEVGGNTAGQLAANSALTNKTERHRLFSP